MKFLLPFALARHHDQPSGVLLAQPGFVRYLVLDISRGSRLRLICFLAAVTILLSIAACRRGTPVFDPTPGPTQADGTISGTVRGPEGTSAIEGRDVAVINVDTGVRATMKTNNAGGFTFKVKPGRYRVELALVDGEVLVKQPGVISVNRSDVDAHADFVVGSKRASRPRFTSPRGFDGLGSPSA